MALTLHHLLVRRNTDPIPNTIFMRPTATQLFNTEEGSGHVTKTRVYDVRNQEFTTW